MYVIVWFTEHAELIALLSPDKLSAKTADGISAAIEAEISQLEDDEQAEYLESVGLEEPGLHKVIREGYSHTPTHKEIRAAQRRDAAHKGNESTAESKFFSFFDSKGKEKKGKAPPAAPRPPANASAPR